MILQMVYNQFFLQCLLPLVTNLRPMKNVIYISKHFIIKTTWFPDEIDLVHAVVIPYVFFLYLNPSVFFQNGFSDYLIAVTWEYAKVSFLYFLVCNLINFCFFHGAAAVATRVSGSWTTVRTSITVSIVSFVGIG